MKPEPSDIRDHRDLIVRQEAMDIAGTVCSLTRRFPRDEAFGLTAQMRHAAVSMLERQAHLTARIGLLPTADLAERLPPCERPGKRLVLCVRSLERGQDD